MGWSKEKSRYEKLPACRIHTQNKGSRLSGSTRMLTCSILQTTFILTLVGAASALVARSPMKIDTGNSLIEYQPWCPVCDTVALNNKCLSEHASCRGSVFKYVESHLAAAVCQQPGLDHTY